MSEDKKPPEPESEPLAFVTTKDLMTEILKRCDHGAIVTLRQNVDAKGHGTTQMWAGDPFVAMGLLHMLLDDILQQTYDCRHPDCENCDRKDECEGEEFCEGFHGDLEGEDDA